MTTETNIPTHTASTTLIDLDALLAPISDSAPTGRNVREPGEGNDLYRDIKHARTQARSAERNALFSEEPDTTAREHWQTILKLAPTLLTQHTKDLEIAAWYIEALLRDQSFHGLWSGFELVNGLLTHFWDGLYPEPDEDGIETKVAAFIGLNGDTSEGTLIAPLRLQSLNNDLIGRSFNYGHYQQALDLEKISDEETRMDRIRNAGFELSEIKQAMLESGEQHCLQLLTDLQTSIDQFQQLSDRFYETCHHEAPPSSTIKETLDQILRAANHLGADLINSNQQTASADNGETDVSTPEPPTGQIPGSDSAMTTVTTAQPHQATASVVATSINNRAQALEQLSAIADFFRSTEPHSPVAGAIERAVRWGKMPLEELILELLPDASARGTYAQLTGIGSTADAPAPETSSPENNSTSHEGSW